MQFTLEAIQEAQMKYTGPDFPKLIREFKAMGMVTNTYDLSNGQIQYVSNKGEHIDIKSEITVGIIGETYDEAAALAALKNNQTGKTDFITFCKEIAEAGVYKWISDLEIMTCSYYDRKENTVIVEMIPSA